MKRSYLLLAIFGLLSVSTFAQDRPRFFDNFDTSRGVNVVKPTLFAIPKSLIARNLANKSKFRSLIKKTVQTRMSVSDGLAQPEVSRKVGGLRMMMAPSSGMKGFTTGDFAIDAFIVDSSRKYGIDPLLIYSQMHQESSFKLRATSNKGASGLMQLMPATARRLGVTNIYDAKQNIDGGIRYMRMLLDMFGQDINLALAGYNAGEGAVMRYGNQIPPYNETQEYVRRISARYSSITNPSMARTIQRVSGSQAAKLAQNVAPPLSINQDAVAVLTPDGKMRLVN